MFYCFREREILNGFSLFPSGFEKLSDNDLLINRHGKSLNTEKWGQFDCSTFSKDDVVLLIDGDWLAFSSCSNEMKRQVSFTYDGVTQLFDGCYTEMKLFCERNNIPYKAEEGRKVQFNHANAVNFAKASCKRKIHKAIKATGASKVVIFCGSSGNHRNTIKLPKLDDHHYYRYKGHRDVGWIPETLKTVKSWLMNTWSSHWAVGEEADDCLTITKKSLDDRGIMCYLHGIDKDFNGEQIGGLYLVGHHENPVYFEDTPENRLGWVEIEKTKGGGEKMKGHGAKFLCYQILCSDDTDNYSAKKALKVLGTLKTLSNNQCKKYLDLFNTEQELWQGVVDHFEKHLPPVFEYVDCFDNKHICTPVDLLNVFYQCAKMREYKDHTPDIFSDKLIPFGVIVNAVNR